jgi:hypothetical protein
MEFRSPFRRRGEKPTPEDQPKQPEERLTEYLDLLLKSGDVSTMRDGNLVILRTATDRDVDGAVASIDYFEGETDELARQTILTTLYEDHRMVWNVYEKAADSAFADEYHENDPQAFVAQMEEYFGDKLEAWKQTR